MGFPVQSSGTCSHWMRAHQLPPLCSLPLSAACNSYQVHRTLLRSATSLAAHISSKLYASNGTDFLLTIRHRLALPSSCRAALTRLRMHRHAHRHTHAPILRTHMPTYLPRAAGNNTHSARRAHQERMQRTRTAHRLHRAAPFWGCRRTFLGL